jgi:hypothetical protein
MNRVLRRPMFRTGGSAEGITSGLDQTKLTASRPMYNRGRVVEPGGYKGEKEEYERMNKILQDIRGPQESRFPEFLTSMGLDLLTRPKSGNIFQQVAASAKGPYSEWMAARAASGAEEDKLSAALLGDVMDVQARKELQKAKLESEERQAQIEAGGKDKQFEFEGIHTALDKLIKQQRELEADLREAQKGTGAVEGVPGKVDPVSPKIDPDQIRSIEDSLEDNAKLQSLYVDDEKDPIRKTLLQAIANGEAVWSDLVYYDEMGELPPELLEEGRKEGGRVGYQNAGAVMPNAMPSAMPAAMQAPRTMDQGQDDTVQDLSFEELRSRLPQEITNDIVKLLSESKQALVDFANIRTQQDVNAFNQKYDVNLVVPQEV